MPGRGPAPRGARHLTLACAAALLTLALAAAAFAQGGDPASDPVGAASDPYGTWEAQIEDARATTNQELDTDHTPKAKETTLWEQVGGAVFPRSESEDGTTLVQESPTSFDTDLYTVSARNPQNAFAGGSVCREAPESEPGEGRESYGERVTGCDRVPVIYRFTETAQHGAVWEEAYRGDPDADPGGFVGAIAWISSTRAVAVGGTGRYPYREHPRDPQGVGPTGVGAESYEQWLERDPAGEGRVWLYDPARYGDTGWHDITDALPEGTRGMNALAFHPGSNVEFGAAGGLGQLVHWEDGTFTELIDRESSAEQIASADLFEYRVRDIEFLPGERVRGFAVTSGCCAEGEALDAPRYLAYGFTSGGSQKWFVHSLPPHNVALDARVVPNTRANPRPDLPESLYSLTAVQRAAGFDAVLSLLATPGGPPQRGEEPSRLTIACTTALDGSDQSTIPFFSASALYYPASDTLRSSLSTSRLVAADGDGARSSLRTSTTSTCGDFTGLPAADWSVGELRSTALGGLGARGLAFATHLSPSLIGETLNVDYDRNSQNPLLPVLPPNVIHPSLGELAAGSYKPTNRDRLGSYLRAAYLLLPSYSLNAIDIVGDSGRAWAVGERGAILKLVEGNAAAAAKASEPPPPELGAVRPRPLSDRSPYEQARPAAASEVADVPSLGSRPPIALDHPRLEPAGSPNPGATRFEKTEDVAQIVMSRDGSEGWAIGPHAQSYDGAPTQPNTRDIALSLYHFDGTTWSRCDFFGVEGQLPADPACAGIAGLRQFVLQDGGGAKRVNGVKLLAAARVPYENDSDPTNDDEFEVVAIGSLYQTRLSEVAQFAILRYRDGRWRLEDAEARAAITRGNEIGSLLGVAFAAPDDGWILETSTNTTDKPDLLYRFDGVRWISCSKEPERCGNPGRLLRKSQTGAAPKGLVSAGDRVYVYGDRGGFPMILTHAPGEQWSADPDKGGYDPGCVSVDAEGKCVASDDIDARGFLASLQVAETADGGYEGWAVGGFAMRGLGDNPVGLGSVWPKPAKSPLMRLTPEEGWRPFVDPGAAGQYLTVHESSNALSSELRTSPPMQAVLAGREGASPALVAQRRSGRIFAFDPERERFELIEAERPPEGLSFRIDGMVQALAPDGEGGAWVALRSVDEEFWRGPQNPVQFLHYTDRPPEPVFSEAPHPFRGSDGSLTALAGAPDGTVWMASDAATLARYDPIGGWERIPIPGWDPGRIAINPSDVNAIALGPSGEGVAVGKGGRIANLSVGAVVLDRAAGTLCDLDVPAPPCGTGRDLHAAAVAPDGSAIVGGERLALLWRPAGGEFRAIARPGTAANAKVTGLSMPSADRAYLTTDSGFVFRGDLGPAGWSWSPVPENFGPTGEVLSLDFTQNQLALRAIAVDSQGHGFAVGERGLILERTGDGEHPWRRLKTPFLDNFTAVALPAEQGNGALVGGENGVILTREGGRFEFARRADYFRYGGGPFSLTGPVVGLALMPGPEPGQAQAWAGIHAPGENINRVLRYASDPADPLLDPAARSKPLADVPGAREGEISLAAFGGTGCRLPPQWAPCGPAQGTTASYEVLARRVVDEISARAQRPGGPSLALFTGNATDSAPGPGSDTIERASLDTGTVADAPASGSHNGALKLRSWAWLVADRLAQAGVPLYGAIGPRDLSEVSACTSESSCPFSTRHVAKAGDNFAWRQAMLSRPAPWGLADPPEDGSYAVEPLVDRGAALRYENQEFDADKEGALRPQLVPTGGASTHYGFDLVDSEDGGEVARIVFLDSSLRSLAASDSIQQPLEADGGQLAWLEAMLCFRGERTPTGDKCTREPEQQAIVVTNTPTYSYGPPTPNDTATDGAVLESYLLRYRANLVLSGRLGWNGRYWATAPGLHVPCPGGDYVPDERAPQPGTRTCDGTAAGGQIEAPSPPDLGDSTNAANATGLLPFVVAGAGSGTFGPDGSSTGSASDGFWHGYSIVRLAAEGDPRKTIVEQRPIYDWISLEAPDHVVSAREKMTVSGTGRSPIGFAPGRNIDGFPEARFDRIDSAAVTHRYDLVLADPGEPWLPCEAGDPGCEALHSKLAAAPTRSDGGASAAADSAAGFASGTSAGDNPCDPYLCLPERVATIDRITGEVRAGNGKYPDTFAVAMLSVGEKVASWPLYFKKSPSFVIEPFSLTAPLPAPPSAAPNPPQPPSPPNPPQPNVPQPSVPDIPAPPAVPPIAAASAPEPQPPAPPAPPPPTEQPSPLSLTLAPPGIAIATPTAVIQPPTPPVNPAPPGGARREARQRQAAAQKSGADSDESQQGMSDLADGPPEPKGTAFARHDRTRPEPSFTPLARADQPSAWAQGALYTGGIALVAFGLAAGWSRGRPTPRSRPPEVPAPSFARAQRNGR